MTDLIVFCHNVGPNVRYENAGLNITIHLVSHISDGIDCS